MAQAEVLADLEGKVGTEVFLSDWITITQEHVNDFARISGDDQ